MVPRKPNRPTLKSIAQETGLSVAAVSRILRGDEKFKEQSIRLVQEVAARVGYVADPAGVRLRTGKNLLIAFVLASEAASESMTSMLINALAVTLRKTQYRLTVYPTFPDEDPLHAIQDIVRNSLADGIIMNRIEPDDARIKYLMEHNFPFITHGRSNLSEQHDYYDFDNFAYGEFAVRDLAERGCKQVMLLAPPLSQSYGQAMFDGATKAARENGLEFRMIDGVTNESRSDAIGRVVRDILVSDKRPDGFIASSARTCHIMTRAIEKLNLDVGRDVCVVTKDVDGGIFDFCREVTVQKEDTRLAGEYLAKSLLLRINDHTQPLRQRLDGP